MHTLAWSRASQSRLLATTLLGSTDVSTHIVSLAPVRIADFGHADLFLANQAESLAWQPILDAAHKGAVTLLFGARDEERNQAVVLRDYLMRKVKH